MKKKRSLKDVLHAIDEVPEAVDRWITGRAGRWPKWTGGEYVDELNVAIDVELERISRGITKVRTPADVFDFVAGKRDISRRSVERFYARHRAEARTWARYYSAVLPKRREMLRALVELYGEGIAALPVTWIDRLYKSRDALKPSEIPAFDEQVRRLLARNSRKSGVK